ncbi:GT-D fold domain-containing glycosyltransferase [Cohnella boryungensis]|uniref:GT-D fold domain-containing glycosyltransferase n=1 Tax=Cohnella boryungensis TaxID=768479 RepID=A0ABV8SAI9_9BACL
MIAPSPGKVAKEANVSAASKGVKVHPPARTEAKPLAAKSHSGRTTIKRGGKKNSVAKRKTFARKRRVYKKRREVPAVQPAIERVGEEAVEEKRSYEQGYQDGLNDSGERILADQLPADMIIPDISLHEAVAAGVELLRKRGVPLLDSNSVYEELETALREKRPYAFVRLGDGELLTLAQDNVLTIPEIKRAGPFLPYAGITVPNLEARDELASCLKVATLVGVPMSRHPHFQPLLFAVLRAHGIDYRTLRYTTSTMNYLLEEQGLLLRLLSGRNIVIIGDVAAQLKQTLEAKGLTITGIVTPVNGYDDVTRVLSEAMQHDFDIALVAAGIAAIPIAVHLAGMSGKVTFDFGHLADRMAGLARPERNE